VSTKIEVKEKLLIRTEMAFIGLEILVSSLIVVTCVLVTPRRPGLKAQHTLKLAIVNSPSVIILILSRGKGQRAQLTVVLMIVDSSNMLLRKVHVKVCLRAV
jgi:hypothetical protein